MTFTPCLLLLRLHSGRSPWAWLKLPTENITKVKIMAMTRQFSLENSIYPVSVTVLLQEIHPESGLIVYGARLEDKSYCVFRVWDRFETLPNKSDCTEIIISAYYRNLHPIYALACFWDRVEGSRSSQESDLEYLIRIGKEIVVL